MIFVMPTIQHTGTLFMLREVFAGYKKCSLSAEPSDPGVIFDHTWPGHTAHFNKWLSEYPAITPIRSPERIVYSWLRRERPLEKLNVLIDEWLRLVDEFDIFILPIDHPLRNSWLQKFNEMHGTDLHTDWTVIPSAKDAMPYTGTWEGIDASGQQIARRLTDFYPPPGLNGRTRCRLTI